MPVDFSQFKAKPATKTITGWLSVKKRGRDDLQIEKAKKQAELDRKRRKAKGKMVVTETKRKRSLEESESDDFIVDSSSCGDESINSKQKNRASTVSTEPTSSDEDSTGILNDSKYVGTARTSSKPAFASLRSRRMMAASVSQKNIIRQKNTPKSRNRNVDMDDDEIDEEDSCDDEEEEADFESEEEEEEEADFESEEEEDIILDDDKSEGERKKLPVRAASKKGSKRGFHASSEDSSQESPIQARSAIKKASKVVDLASSEYSSEGSPIITRRPASKKTSQVVDLAPSEDSSEASPMRTRPASKKTSKVVDLAPSEDSIDASPIQNRPVSKKASKVVNLACSGDSSDESPIRASAKDFRKLESNIQKPKLRAENKMPHATVHILSSGKEHGPPHIPAARKKDHTKSMAGSLITGHNKKNTKKSHHFGSDDDKTPAKVKVVGRRSIQDDSDDETPFDLPEDENEQIALALALSESATEVTEQKKIQDKSDKNEVLFKEMEEEDSDDEGGDVQEAFIDREEAKEASYVLSAANHLSAQVLQTMKDWTGDATKGIIVDGALALHTIDSKSTPHSWISQEEMRELLPQVRLADYQLIGVNWLVLLHGMKVTLQGSKEKTNVNGVLADVMGLGKTVQAIAFLAWLRKKNRDMLCLDGADDFDDTDDESVNKGHAHVHRPHLIVVPSSVLTNWQNEFSKFCPEMKVVKYHGSLKERTEIQRELRNHLPGGTNQYDHIDVILTTFSYFSSEKDSDRSFLKKFKVDYLIVDEAHCLKNPNGARYQNLDKFKTSHRLLLTGTPVQNSPEELMSLLCFLMPLFAEGAHNEFGDDEDSRHAGQKMLRHFVEMEGGDVKDDSAAYRKLKQLFAPFVLRRRKEDVLSQILPPKTRRLESVPFDEPTRKVYDSILEDHVKRQRKNPTDSSTQQHLFTQLRKAANHPLLLRTRNTSGEAVKHLTDRFFEYGYFGKDDSCTAKHVQQQLDKMSDFDIHLAALDLIDENPHRKHEMERYTLQESDLFSSPKFERLRVLLPELVHDGHRILIFSQWTKCMDLLGCLMESLDLKFFRLDGQTQISGRQQMIDEFNKNPSIPVFLLSTRAGGMGINLTAADVCILHDLDFNPFNDLQAEDRCHRIGQTKCVTVIKMITIGTVDADIYEMQQRKAKMNAAILADGGVAEYSKADEKEMVGKLLNNALDRFLVSPANEENQNTARDLCIGL